MKIIPREAGRITYSAEIRDLKKRLQLNQGQKEVLIGSILGDGHLAENWSKTNYRLKISQCKEQEEYVNWKYDIFRDWVLTEPKLHMKTNSMRFATISHPEISRFRELFYQGRRKIIPENISELISPLTLAVWFMDDGNVRKTNRTVYGYYINTQSFLLRENEVLVEVLKRKFGVSAAIYKNHGKPRLYIGAESKKAFRRILEPFILPSMQYKLG